jgi:hypothetical protein
LRDPPFIHGDPGRRRADIAFNESVEVLPVDQAAAAEVTGLFPVLECPDGNPDVW